VKGEHLGTDTVLTDANAARDSLRHREFGCRDEEFVWALCPQAGAAAKDAHRSKKGSNVEWVSGTDPEAGVRRADLICHLAGVNRPQTVEEFESGNVGFTAEICNQLEEFGRTPKIVLTSSVQAEPDNPYGVSKREAKEVLRRTPRPSPFCRPRRSVRSFLVSCYCQILPRVFVSQEW